MRKAFKIAKIVVTALLTVLSIIHWIPAVCSEDKTAVWFINIVLTALLVAAGVVVVIYMIYELKDETRHYRFKVQSRQFFNFFSSWYSKPGELSIICDDLDWVTSDKDKRVFEKLKIKIKAGGLQLFLGKGLNADIVNTLKECGAVVKRAPANILAHYSFSCLSVMGNCSGVIVRNKQRDNRLEVEFVEVSNPYVSELLNTLLTGENYESSKAE